MKSDTRFPTTLKLLCAFKKYFLFTGNVILFFRVYILSTVFSPSTPPSSPTSQYLLDETYLIIMDGISYVFLDSFCKCFIGKF